MPAGFAIGRLLIGGQDATGGSASVAVSRRGLTPSYAVLIEGPGGRRQWLLAAGLTGQMVRIDDERQLRDIFEQIGRGDAG